MAVVTVLQLGDAIAGEGVPSVFVGSSLAVRLTVLDDVTQQAVDADATFTQVLCSCTLAAGTYGAGTLVASIGIGGPTFSNVAPVISSGGVVTGVLFQAPLAGPLPAMVAASTLTTIAQAVPGWTVVTNPAQQSQIGQYSVAGTLLSPNGGSTALTITRTSIGDYAATVQLPLEGQYGVQLLGTIGGGAFTFEAQGAVMSGDGS